MIFQYGLKNAVLHGFFSLFNKINVFLSNVMVYLMFGDNVISF